MCLRPYDCIARDRHPDHAVWRCEPHGVWWHEQPVPDPLTAGERRHLEGCSRFPCASCLEYTKRVDEAAGSNTGEDAR